MCCHKNFNSTIADVYVEPYVNNNQPNSQIKAVRRPNADTFAVFGGLSPLSTRTTMPCRNPY